MNKPKIKINEAWGSYEVNAKISPRSNWLVVRPDNAKKETEGGILLPDQAQEKPSRGVVLATGPGLWENGKRTPIDFQEGDVVLFQYLQGNPTVEVNGEEFTMVRATEVLGVVE